MEALLEAHWKDLTSRSQSTHEVLPPCPRRLHTSCVIHPRLVVKPKCNTQEESPNIITVPASSSDVLQLPPHEQGKDTAQELILVFGGKVNGTTWDAHHYHRGGGRRLRGAHGGSESASSARRCSRSLTDRGEIYLSDVHAFDVASRQWLEVAEDQDDPHRPLPRAYHAMACLDNSFFVSGGKTGQTLNAQLQQHQLDNAVHEGSDPVLDDLWRCDVQLVVEDYGLGGEQPKRVMLRWTQLGINNSTHFSKNNIGGDAPVDVVASPPPPPPPRQCYHGMVLHQTKSHLLLICYGGHTGKMLNDVVHVFDVPADGWLSPVVPHHAPRPPSWSSNGSGDVAAECTHRQEEVCRTCGVRFEFCSHTSATLRPLLIRQCLQSSLLIRRGATDASTLSTSLSSIPPRDGHTMVGMTPFLSKAATEEDTTRPKHNSEYEVLIFGGEIARTSFNTLIKLTLSPCPHNRSSKVSHGLHAEWCVVSGGKEYQAKAQTSPPRDVQQLMRPLKKKDEWNSALPMIDDCHHCSTSGSDQVLMRQSSDASNVDGQRRDLLEKAKQAPLTDERDRRLTDCHTNDCRRRPESPDIFVPPASTGSSIDGCYPPSTVLTVSKSPPRGVALFGEVAEASPLSSVLVSSSGLVAPEHRAFHSAWACGASGVLIYGGVSNKGALLSSLCYFDRLTSLWYAVKSDPVGGAGPGPRAAPATVSQPSMCQYDADHRATRRCHNYCTSCGAPNQTHYLFGGESHSGELMNDVWAMTVHYAGCSSFVQEGGGPLPPLPSLQLTPPPLKRSRTPLGDPSPCIVIGNERLQQEGQPHRPPRQHTQYSLLPLKTLLGLFIKEHMKEALLAEPKPLL